MSNDDTAPDFDIAALERWMAQNVPAPSPVERIEKFLFQNFAGMDRVVFRRHVAVGPPLPNGAHLVCEIG